MHPYELLLLTLLATPSSGHGVVTMVRGANGVDMPGLSGVSPFSTLRSIGSPFPSLCPSMASASLAPPLSPTSSI